MYTRRTRSRCRRFTTRIRSRHSRRTVPIHRSTNAFARGARTGVRIVRMPSAEHLIEPSCELAVAVVDQKADRLLALDERLDDVARLLGRPLTRRVRGDSRQIHL